MDGYAFGMWCHGIMVLNCLTQQRMLQDIKSIEENTFEWYKSVYPVLLDIVQVDHFRFLTSASFLALDFHIQDFEDTLGFVHFLLRVKPVDRPSAAEALQHMFLMKGKRRSEKADSLRIENLCDSADLVICNILLHIKNTLRQKSLKFYRNKFCYNRISQHRNRKGRKTPKGTQNYLKSLNYDVAPSGISEQYLEGKNKVYKTWIKDREFKKELKTCF